MIIYRERQIRLNYGKCHVHCNDTFVIYWMKTSARWRARDVTHTEAGRAAMEMLRLSRLQNRRSSSIGYRKERKRKYMEGESKMEEQKLKEKRKKKEGDV